MPRISKAISESLYNQCQQALKEQGEFGMVSRKLQAIISAKNHGITAVAKIFGVSRVAIFSWIKEFNNKKIQGLLIKKGRGRKKIFTKTQKIKIKRIIQNNPNITILQLQFAIKDKIGVKASRMTVYRVIKSLKFSYITARKQHYKQNKNELLNFKKNSK